MSLDGCEVIYLLFVAKGGACRVVHHVVLFRSVYYSATRAEGCFAYSHAAPGVDSHETNPHLPSESQLGHVKALAPYSQCLFGVTQTSQRSRVDERRIEGYTSQDCYVFGEIGRRTGLYAWCEDHERLKVGDEMCCDQDEVCREDEEEALPVEIESAIPQRPEVSQWL